MAGAGAYAGAGACAKAGRAAPRIDAIAVAEMREILVLVMVVFLLSGGELSLATEEDASACPT
jgi:hypothetical protein